MKNKLRNLISWCGGVIAFSVFVSSGNADIVARASNLAYRNTPSNQTIGSGILISSFPNKMPEKLKQELADAKSLGVVPMPVGTKIKTDAFDKLIDQGPVKWAISEKGVLLIMPKQVNQREIFHPVLTGGDPVLAAGEASLAGNKTAGYFLLEISNNSGHYQPTASAIDLGIADFKKAGVNTDRAKKTVIDPKKYY